MNHICTPVNLNKILLNLVIKSSVELPEDVKNALHNARQIAVEGSAEVSALETMLQNARLAKANSKPVCQDTGVPIFYIKAPWGFNTQQFQAAAEDAILNATQMGILRQNCVETLTGKNTGTNLGYGSPLLHWHFEERRSLEITLMLKGGGSENMGVQYSLPDDTLGAGRDLEGVRRCILHAVHRAQGMGCAPGILGVAIGGDRATGYVESKLQLLRKIGERSPNSQLAELERRVLREANSLGIGPMGFGGNTTLLDVFIGSRTRLPASYFVSISYMCWCCRRQTVTID